MNRLQNLQSQGIDEMVLDLRYNSGGEQYLRPLRWQVL